MKTSLAFLLGLTLATTAALSGCQHGSRPASARASRSPVVLVEPSVEIDRYLEARVQRAMERPDVDGAIEAFVDRLFEDPALGVQMGRIGERLLADPKVAASLDAFTEELVGSAEVQREVARIMETRPELSGDEVGDHFGAQIEATFEAHVAPGFPKAFEAFLASLDVGPQSAGFMRHLRARFGAAVDAYVAQPGREAAWNRRLVELNHGQMPRSDVATRLFIDHALSEERIARFLVTVLEDPAVSAELVALVRRALAVKSVEDALYAWARRMSVDPELRRQCLTGMLLLIAESPDPAALTSVLRAGFAAPSMRAGATELVRVFLTDRDVRASIDASFTRLAQIPALARATDELLDRW